MRSTHSQELSDGTMNKYIHPRVCALQECRKEFAPRRHWQKFCSRECKDRHWAQLRREVMKVVRDSHENPA